MNIPWETSSHDSGIVHSGIYYLLGMLKATLCRKGNGIIYDTCKKLGKFMVATDENDVRGPDKPINNGRKNGIDDLVMLDRRDVSRGS